MSASFTEQVSEKLTEIITALVGATDQREGGGTDNSNVETQVALEALRGLAALLPRLPQETVLQHTPTLLIRIRLFSEKVMLFDWKVAFCGFILVYVFLIIISHNHHYCLHSH